MNIKVKSVSTKTYAQSAMQLSPQKGHAVFSARPSEGWFLKYVQDLQAREC